jgi:hypothetical protein
MSPQCGGLQLKTSKPELRKLQRLASWGITGAIRIPMMANEVLLGFSSLHLQLEAEVKAGVYRLNCNEQWTHKLEGFGHACMTWNMKKEPISQMGTDKK